jgi:hypothetical protein
MYKHVTDVFVSSHCCSAHLASRAQVGKVYVTVGNVRVGTTKIEQEAAANTVFWRTDNKKGIKQGVASCNFQTMRKILEAEDVQVQIPAARLVKQGKLK